VNGRSEKSVRIYPKGEGVTEKTGQELLRDIDDCALPEGALAFWWLGQMSFVVKVGDLVLYVDPYLAERDTRLVAPLLDATRIRNADYVLCSHDHGDHLDPVATMGIAVASPRAAYVCSAASAAHLSALGIDEQRIISLDGDTVFQRGELAITAIPAAHEGLDHQVDLGYPHLSFVVEHGPVCLYMSGDSLCYDGMPARLSGYSFDLAVVPINGRDGERLRRGCIGNMTCQEAVDLVGLLHPRLAVPGHYDMFANNPGDVSLFAEYMDVKYPDVPYWIGKHGERVILPAE